MHLNMLKGVLFDIANTEIGMLFNSAQLRNCFSSEKFDQGGLSGAICPNDGRSGRKSESTGDVLK